MALLTVATVAIAGVTPTTPATPTATTGDTFLNTGREVVELVNGSGSPVVVTIDVQRTTDGDGATVTDPTVTVAAGARKFVGPFPASYNDASGLVKITFASVTSNTITVLKVPAL